MEILNSNAVSLDFLGYSQHGWYRLSCQQEIRPLRNLDRVTLTSILVRHQLENHNGVLMAARWFHQPTKTLHNIKTILRFLAQCSGSACGANLPLPQVKKCITEFGHFATFWQDNKIPFIRMITHHMKWKPEERSPLKLMAWIWVGNQIPGEGFVNKKEVEDMREDLREVLTKTFDQQHGVQGYHTIKYRSASDIVKFAEEKFSENFDNLGFKLSVHHVRL